MARAVPMWALLLVLLMAAVAVVAFGATPLLSAATCSDMLQARRPARSDRPSSETASLSNVSWNTLAILSVGPRTAIASQSSSRAASSSSRVAA